MRGNASRLGVLLAFGTLALVLAGTATSGLFSPFKQSANDTLIYAGASDPTYLDPTLVSDGESFRVTAQIFESLVSLKPGSTVIQPGLATKWNSPNGKDWTFFLRKGVKFHDGTRFNAASVCYNFNRQYNFTGPFQDGSATYYWQTVFLGFHHNASADLSPSLYKSCTTRGQYVAVIHLAKRSSSFLPALVISSFAIQSPTALKKYGANKGELRNGTFKPTGTYAFSHPTGTGPFQFESWRVGESVSLKRFAGYWGKKPKLARIIIRPISNNTARVQALQTGEVFAADLIQPQDVPTIQRSANLKLVNRPSFNVAYVGFHQGPGSPMNDLKVRQAAAYGLDRAAVVGSFYAGRAQVAQEFQPPTLFGWTNKVPKYTFQPQKSRDLLNSSSCHVPCKVDFWYPTGVSRPYMPDPKRNFEAFSASLERAGFNVVAHSAPWRPDYVAKVNDGTAGDINMIGWTGDFGDPDNFLGTFFKTYAPSFGFRNAAIFNILSKAAGEPNFAKRVKLYQQANIMIMKFLPGVPYAHSRPALGFLKRVGGYVASPVGTDPFAPVFIGGQ
ncbi:MAG: peptide/nickel transport system substrate-binding protein [Gaiellaceae bacterium]|jgi:peptide/nickel transport system substrate-binding protein|nr:peptide/nickel transport system substrate-binding protein [Gaiellaceae bacterium]